MNPENIPESLKYSRGLKPLNIPGSRVNTRRFQPETSVSGYTAVNRTIRIPLSGSDAFVDTTRSYLRFSVQTTISGGNPNTVYLDNSAYSLIDSIRVIDQATGMVLEEINGYNIIMNRLANLSFDNVERNTIEGDYAGFAAIPYSNFSFSNGTEQYFMLPVLGSGLLNLTSSAHAGGQGLLLPLALISGLVLEINLVPNYKDAFVWDNGGTTQPTTFTWEVKNVSYDATVVSFDTSVVEAMRQAGQQGIFVSSYTWHGQQVSDSSDAVSLNMNERAKSIKSVHLIPRLNSQNNDLTQMITASPAPTNNGTMNAYLQLASAIYPNVQLNYYTDIYRELKKAVGGAVDGVITRSMFEGSTTTFVNGVEPANFTNAYDLETVGGREFLENGYNNQTNSQPIIINLKYNSAVARTYQIATLVDMVVKFDTVMRTVSVSW